MNLTQAVDKRFVEARRHVRISQARKEFLAFCSLLQVVPKQGGNLLPFILSPTQRALNAARTGRDIVVKGRQVHVTTLELARDLWWFIGKPASHVVVVCQSKDDRGPMKDIVEKLRVFFESLINWGVGLEFGHHSDGEWSLPANNSTLRVVQAGATERAAEKGGRAGTVNRLHFTEAAYYEHGDITMNAIINSVPGPETGSEIIIESTANGVGGVFHDQWLNAVSGQNGYRPHFLRWWLHPEYVIPLEPGDVIEPSDDAGKSYEGKLIAAGASRENLKWYRRKMAEPGMGRDKTLQEYPVDPQTCFLVSGRPFFDAELVQAMIHTATQPIRIEQHGQLRIWNDPVVNAHYVISVDTAEGTSPDNTTANADFCAAGVFRRNGDQCATLHGRWPPWEFAKLIAALGRRYNRAEIAVERNNHGWSVLEALVKGYHYPLPQIWHAPDGKWGWHTNNITRPQMLDKLDEAVRCEGGPGKFRTNDTLALGEMQTFVFGPNGKPEAAQGCHDDLVVMAAIGWSVICRPRGPQRNLKFLPPR